MTAIEQMVAAQQATTPQAIGSNSIPQTQQNQVQTVGLAQQVEVNQVPVEVTALENKILLLQKQLQESEALLQQKDQVIEKLRQNLQVLVSEPANNQGKDSTQHKANWDYGTTPEGKPWSPAKKM